MFVVFINNCVIFILQSIYNAIGEALSRTGEALEAEEWFKKALEMQPDLVPAHLTYGKMLARNVSKHGYF